MWIWGVARGQGALWRVGRSPGVAVLPAEAALPGAASICLSPFVSRSELICACASRISGISLPDLSVR